MQNDPKPATHVEVEYKPVGKPGKVQMWALQPYRFDDTVKEPSRTKLKTEFDGIKLVAEIPAFTYYTLVVIRE